MYAKNTFSLAFNWTGFISRNFEGVEKPKIEKKRYLSATLKEPNHPIRAERIELSQGQIQHTCRALRIHLLDKTTLKTKAHLIFSELCQFMSNKSLPLYLSK